MSSSNNTNNNGFARATQHDPNTFFRSTVVPLFNRVMADAGNALRYNNIGQEDVEGGNAAIIISDFVRYCNQNPPISRTTRKPMSADTLQKAISSLTSGLPVGQVFPTQHVQ